jgi:hypothetical protein
VLLRPEDWAAWLYLTQSDAELQLGRDRRLAAGADVLEYRRQVPGAPRDGGP